MAKFAVRLHLPNGEKMAMPCESNWTFGTIKAKVWAKKRFLSLQMGDFVFKLINGEILLADGQPFTRLLDLRPIFEEGGADGKKKKLLELLIVKKDDLSERQAREAKKPPDYEPPLCQGPLSMKGSFAWKKLRHFVLQGYTLYYWDSEEQFTQKKPAVGWYPLGAATASQGDMEGSDYCISITQFGQQQPVLLYSESQQEIKTWIQAINDVYMRRTKTIVVNCMEELRERKALKTEGLFRVSGRQEEMMSIRQAYEDGLIPNLNEIKDPHALAGLIKMVIRELPNPLLTHMLYDPLIKLADLPDIQERMSILSTVLASLPPNCSGLLQYVMTFLHEVSTYADVNKMESKNLSIVFAPNILRPREESAITAMQNTRPVLIVVETMISQCLQLWPPRDPVEAFAAEGQQQPHKSQPAVPLSPRQQQNQSEPLVIGGMGGKAPLLPGLSRPSSGHPSVVTSPTSMVPRSVSTPQLVKVQQSSARSPPPRPATTPRAGSITGMSPSGPPPRPATTPRRVDYPMFGKVPPKLEPSKKGIEWISKTKAKYAEAIVKSESGMPKQMRRVEKGFEDALNALKEQNISDEELPEADLDSHISAMESAWAQWEQATASLADKLDQIKEQMLNVAASRVPIPPEEPPEEKKYNHLFGDDDDSIPPPPPPPSAPSAAPGGPPHVVKPRSNSTPSGPDDDHRPKHGRGLSRVLAEQVSLALSPLGPILGGPPVASGAPFHLPAQSSPVKSSPAEAPPYGEFYAEVLYDHAGESEDNELSLREGEKLIVLDSTDPDGWWLAKREATGEEGLVPSNFLKRL